ncbi:MAG: phosphonopyruvate decarboxylase, partial [Candidatus Thorarchaeota archaeon]
MPVEQFIIKLKELGFDYYVGVPCSFFKSTINYVIDDLDIDYHMAVNEGAALAMAAGAKMAGKNPVIMLQNSGFGNLVNPMTSLSMIFDIPTLLLISGRHYKVEDEPQHTIMGNRMIEILEGFDLAHHVLPKETNAIEETLEKAVKYMKTKKKPIVLIVQKGTFSDYTLQTKINLSSKGALMTRSRAIEILTEFFVERDAVVSTTGKISRILYVLHDNPQNFYMMGSMGHAISIGLGVALSQPTRRVIVIDGDGAALMHLGAMSTVGHYHPSNFIHIVLDNEAHESTGGQFTTSGTTDLPAVALACNYETGINIT